MSVTATDKNEKLILELDNGDRSKLKEVIERWNFKDEQSFLRFTISMLLCTEDKVLWIKENGDLVQILPPQHSIKE